VWNEIILLGIVFIFAHVLQKVKLLLHFCFFQLCCSSVNL